MINSLYLILVHNNVNSNFGSSYLLEYSSIDWHLALINVLILNLSSLIKDIYDRCVWALIWYFYHITH